MGARPGVDVRCGRRRATRGATVVGLAVAALLLASCDWTQVGFGPGRAYSNPIELGLDAGTVGSLAEAYTVALPTGHVGDPIVAGQAMAAASLDPAGTTATVSTWDVTTGLPGWSVAVPGAAKAISALVSYGDTFIVAVLQTDDTLHLVALNRVDGSVRWNQPVPVGKGDPRDPLSLDPTLMVLGSRVVVGLSDGFYQLPAWATYELSNVDAGTGTVLWERSAFTGAGGVTVGSSGGDLALNYGENPHPGLPTGYPSFVVFDASGTTVWSHDALSDLIAITISMSSDDRFYASSSSGDLLSYDAGSGTVDTDVIAGTPLAATDSTLITGEVSGIAARSVSTGEVRWTWSPPGTLGQVAIGGSVVYAPVTSGGTTVLTFLDLADGHVIGSVPVAGSATPIVASAHVLLDVGGTVHAYAPTGPA